MFVEEYSVIDIVGEKSILIDYGRVHGAKRGRKIRIIIPGDMIIHPKTKEELGTFDYVKDELEIAVVYEKFSLCAKVKRTSTLSNPISQIVTTQIITVDKEEISSRKWVKDDVIRIGDIVQLI
jgi:hypothetical protein